MFRTTVLLVTIFVSGGSSTTAMAEELSYRHGEMGGSKAYYSPSDFYDRGVIFRVQTGQAGLYRLCNDDGLKRYSPYIEWSQINKQKPSLLVYEVSSVLKDAQRKVIRWNWGKAACGNGNCR